MTAALDPGIIFGCLLALGFLYVSSWFLTRSIGLLDVNIPVVNVRPFHTVVQAIINAIEDGANAAIKATEKALAWAWSDLLSSLQLLLGLTLFFGDLLLHAFEYLWNHSLPALIAREIGNAISSLAPTRVDPVALAAKIETTVEAKLRHEVATIRSDAQHALSDAKAAAASAASAAASAEHAVVTNVENVVQNPTTYVTKTVAEVIPGLAAALAVAEGEVVGLPGVDWDKLRDLVNGQDLAKLGGLIAAIPLLRALTNTFAAETGLGNAECRSKVKGICGTDPLAWGRLLGGLAALGFAFSLKDLADVAEPLVHELAVVVKQAA